MSKKVGIVGTVHGVEWTL